MEEETKEPMEETKAEPVEQPTQEPAAKERPTFLTVLCILSFIGVGLTIIQSITRFFATKASSALMDATGVMDEMEQAMQEVPGGDIVTDSVSTIVDKGPMLATINLIAALVVLAGVLMMWNLKRTGYYIYIVGEIAPVVALVVVGGLLGGFLAIITSVFAILFIILYGLNVKHMT